MGRYHVRNLYLNRISRQGEEGILSSHKGFFLKLKRGYINLLRVLGIIYTFFFKWIVPFLKCFPSPRRRMSGRKTFFEWINYKDFLFTLFILIFIADPSIESALKNGKEAHPLTTRLEKSLEFTREITICKILKVYYALDLNVLLSFTAGENKGIVWKNKLKNFAILCIF